MPRDGAEGVAVYETPVYTDTYQPFIRVRFTEPISEATLTTDSFFVSDAQAQRLGGRVEYDGTLNVGWFIPSEPLAPGQTYEGTITTDLYDTSGNPLAADYVWIFRTEVGFRIYLPLVIKSP